MRKCVEKAVVRRAMSLPWTFCMRQWPAGAATMSLYWFDRLAILCSNLQPQADIHCSDLCQDFVGEDTLPLVAELMPTIEALQGDRLLQLL